MMALARQPFVEVTLTDAAFHAMQGPHDAPYFSDHLRAALVDAGMDLGREIVEWYDQANRTRHWRQYLPPNVERLHELATGIKLLPGPA